MWYVTSKTDLDAYKNRLGVLEYLENLNLGWKIHCPRNEVFFLRISSVSWPNRQFPADLVAFTEEILNGKLHFFCSDTSLPSRNKTLAVAVKNYAKTDIKVLWSCPVLPNLSILLEIFCSVLFVKTFFSRRTHASLLQTLNFDIFYNFNNNVRSLI